MTAADQPTPARLRSEMVDDIPVLVAEPDPGSRNGRLALWMHFLSGNKEAMEPFLLRLAESGFVAVSLDAWQHGARTQEGQFEILNRCFAHFRRHVWPILGHMWCGCEEMVRL